MQIGRVFEPFDAVDAYTLYAWGKEDSLQTALANTRDVLTELRRQVGAKKEIIYTFWVANRIVDGPGQLSGADILAIVEEALKLGIKNIDYYGYRIGDFRIFTTNKKWRSLLPGKDETYPVIPRLPGKFLVDRPDVLQMLAEFQREHRTH
jgi:hypothetical protein